MANARKIIAQKVKAVAAAAAGEARGYFYFACNAGSLAVYGVCNAEFLCSSAVL